MYHIKAESYHSDEPLYHRLRGGDGTFFVPEARVAKDYFNTGLYERGYISWACENFIKEDKEVVDIGAHIGMYTVEMARRAKRVHSFECSPKSYNYLCANILLRDLSYKVKTYNTALSNHTGTTPYYIRDPLDGGGNSICPLDVYRSCPSVEVPMTTLDSFGLTNINFIKADVEGHEEYVFRGAVKTLEENDYPPILFESWPERMNDVPAKEIRIGLFEFLGSLNYKVQPVHGGDDMFLATR
jgi:FkbM family methyltransferase